MRVLLSALVMCSAFLLVAQSPPDLLHEYLRLDSAFLQLKDNNPASAVEVCGQQIAIADQLSNDSLWYIAARNHATQVGTLGLFEQAMQEAYKMISRLEAKNPNDIRIAKLYSIIGNLFTSMNDFKKSYEYYTRSKQFLIAHHSYTDTASINSEIALCLAGMDRDKEAIELAKQSIALLKAGRDTDALCVAIDNLSNIYYALADYPHSIEYQLQILSYPTFFHGSLRNKTATFEHLGEIYCMAKQYHNAQPYLDSAFKYAQPYGSNDWLYECYRWQSVIDEWKGNYPQALANHKRYLSLKDSVYQQQYGAKMSVMYSLYDLARKQREIDNLYKDKLLQQAHIQQLYLLVGGLILVVIIILLVITNRNQRRQRLLSQQFAAQLIATQEAERQRIAKDLHDSVGQNILFIKNQVQLLNPKSDSPLSQSVDAALEEVRTISKDLYPNQLDRYGLVVAVDMLCEQIKLSSQLFVSSDIQIPEEQLSKAVKINSYRIIQECIHNTLKHSAATVIRITGECIAGQIQLTVQDNGTGFDIQILRDAAQHSSGILNIEERVRILGGKFNIETAPGKGTKSIFIIPII